MSVFNLMFCVSLEWHGFRGHHRKNEAVYCFNLTQKCYADVLHNAVALGWCLEAAEQHHIRGVTPNQASVSSPEESSYQAYVASRPCHIAAELVPPLHLPLEDQRLTFLSPGRQNPR